MRDHWLMSSHSSSTSGPSVSPPTKAAGLVTGAATLSAAVALVAIELVPTGLSSVSSAVSETGLTDYAWAYQWFTVSLAVAGAAGAWISRVVFSRRIVLLSVLFLLLAAGRSLVGWVPMDAPGAEGTTMGFIHWLLGIITFVSFVVLALVAAGSLRQHVDRGWFGMTSRVLGLVGLVCLIVMGLRTAVPAAEDVFGLFQRVLYVALVLWLGCYATTAWRSNSAAR